MWDKKQEFLFKKVFFEEFAYFNNSWSGSAFLYFFCQVATLEADEA